MEGAQKRFCPKPKLPRLNGLATSLYHTLKSIAGILESDTSVLPDQGNISFQQFIFAKAIFNT